MTLAQLEEWYVLGGRCAVCRREGFVDRWELARRFGKHSVIASLMPRLRCTVCNNRGNNTWITGKIRR